MFSNPAQIAHFTFGAVVVCWLAFGALFVLRKRPPQAAERRRDRVAFLGIFLQGLANAVVWFRVPGRANLQMAALPATAELLLATFTIALAIGSVWLANAAVRRLGQQWAVAARLIEGHKLITDGPYRFVRNPIYIGMLGMLIATGLALHDWTQLGAGTVLFFIGTVIRINSEEKLLRSAFGKEFEEYARRVPAVLPGIY